MSSTLPVATSKSLNSPSQTAPSSQIQSNSSATFENHPQRRSGSVGTGAALRNSPTSARNNQSLRKQHKAQRRPRLADEDALAESAAMQSTSSRKGRTSITHLMNFTLPPRPQNNQHHHYIRNAGRNPSWGLGSGYHAVDKARYIHANYRFLVDPRGDYRAQATDADVHLDWSNVLQILASAQSQLSNCPICLSKPVAPRMAKCGHIFCLPCLIRYMHSTEDTVPFPEKRVRWKKCPICWDSIYMSEIRPVRWFMGQEGESPHEGADIVLRLIARQPGSTLALPRDGAESLDRLEDVPWYFAAEVSDYARIMKGSEDFMVEHYEQEISELQIQEKEDELLFGDNSMWTRKAVSSINEAKEKLKGVGNPPSKQRPERRAKHPPTNHDTSTSDVPVDCLTPSAPGSGLYSPRGIKTSPEPSAFSTVEDRDHAAKNTQGLGQHNDRSSSISGVEGSVRLEAPASKDVAISALRQTSDRTFYFYQALRHYYLSPLDIRILKAAFGDFGSFPSTILPRVERVSTGHIIDDDLRKRAKYLAHLPHGCEVGFLECDWTDVVAPEVLEGFAAEIDRRRKKNREKEVREEKERLRAEKEEDEKRWATARRRRPTPPSELVPTEDFQPLPSLEERGESSSWDGSVTATSSPPWPSSRQQTGSAFASLASPSTSPAASRTVWGTAAVAPVSPTLPPTQAVHDASENDGWLQHWEQDLLQEDELLAQFEAQSLDGSKTVGPLNNKKKKNKKITLMTTNARRGA